MTEVSERLNCFVWTDPLAGSEWTHRAATGFLPVSHRRRCRGQYSSGSHISWLVYMSGQQIRSKIDSFQNAFLFLNQTLWCYHSLESSRRDDFNKGHIIGSCWKLRKLSWKPFCSLFLNCSPACGTVHFTLVCHTHFSAITFFIHCYFELKLT